MVTIIHCVSSVRRAISYNEKKVKKGAADCLDAGYYPKDVKELTLDQKIQRLEKRNELNERTKINTLHISINFAPSDVLDSQKLKQIAAVYLEKIGFVNQPYLLYEHRDTAHKHVHVVTTNICSDGRAINLNNIGKLRSEKARKEIESEFGLVSAENHQKLPAQKVAPLLPVQYGRVEIMRAISAVLQSVIRDYHFSSLSDLNAVLQQYRVKADGGTENSRTFQNQGLVYLVLDEKAKKIGPPIKASAFHFKPTLKRLRERFDQGRIARLKHASRLINTIDSALTCQPSSLVDLTDLLKSRGVVLIARYGRSGQIAELTYVDHRTKSVFSGNDLGQQYSALALEKMFATPLKALPLPAIIAPGEPYAQHWSVSKAVHNDAAMRVPFRAQRNEALLHQLRQPEKQQTAGAWQLRKFSKKRKGKFI